MDHSWHMTLTIISLRQDEVYGYSAQSRPSDFISFQHAYLCKTSVVCAGCVCVQ